MREIKKGDKVVWINPKDKSLWSKDIINAYGDYVSRNTCLAPSPNQRFDIGDFVLQVIGPGPLLLKPSKISAVVEGIVEVNNSCYGIFMNSVVSIRREGSDYIIGDSCKLSTEEFIDRYGCDPIPVHDSTPPECTDIPNPDWPTPKDIEECCGVWFMKPVHLRRVWFDGKINYEVYSSDGSFTHSAITIVTSKKEFENRFRPQYWTKIEPIPPQYIPDYDQPKRETPEWMRAAVERYPSQGG